MTNATDTLGLDLPSAPADGLDMVIACLDRIGPVFDEPQLHLGVNTRYMKSLALFVSSLAHEAALTTQNAERKQIVPAVPKMFLLQEVALKALREIDSAQQRELASEDVNSNGRRSLFGLAQGHVGGLLDSIKSVESNWGSFQIWIKQPSRALCESLIRASRRGELDFEDFLVWFRQDQLGLLGPGLDPYVVIEDRVINLIRRVWLP